MITAYSDARDELFAQFSGAVPGIALLLGYQPLIVYQGKDSLVKSPVDQFWFRISQQTVLEEQSALAGNDLKRRYTTDGLVFVQIFIPKTAPQNYALGLGFANSIKNAYRGKQTSSCMWFRNVRIQELPPEDAWFRLNVVAEYQYDEIG